MNFAAACCGVSKEGELLPMKLCVLRALIPDVFLDRLFIAVLFDGADEVSICPELSAP